MPEDLAAMQNQARRAGRLSDAQVLELQDRLARRMRHVREELVQLAADHLRDDRLHRSAGQRAGGDRLSVSQDGIRLGHLAYFLEKMADINDRLIRVSSSVR